MLNTVSNLTFETTAKFRHWLKKQVGTSFSVPVQTSGSDWAFQYIEVTKRALSTLHIDDNEVINVEINKAKRSGRYYAFVEPKRVENI